MRPALVFDLDGTLVDTAPDLCASTNHVLAHFGRRPLSLDELKTGVGLGARHLIESGLQQTGGVSEAMVDTGHPIFLDHYAANLLMHSRPFDGVRDTLSALKSRGYPMAVCTNKPIALATPLIDGLDLAGFFEAVIGGDSLPVRKPDPAPLYAASAPTGSKTAWMIGDSHIDITAAQNAGWDSVAVRYGYGPGVADALGATHVIDGFADLLALFP